MEMDPISTTALALFFVGVSGMLIRRSLLVAMLPLNVVVTGASLLYCGFAIRRGDAAGLRDALIVSALAMLLSLLGAAISIAIFRRRATNNLDELRELRG